MDLHLQSYTSNGTQHYGNPGSLPVNSVGFVGHRIAGLHLRYSPGTGSSFGSAVDMPVNFSVTQEVTHAACVATLAADCHICPDYKPFTMEKKILWYSIDAGTKKSATL